MAKHASSYLSAKFVTRDKPEIKGKGIFATATVHKGELIAIFGGLVYEWADFQKLSAQSRSLAIQVEDQFFLTAGNISDADYVNHCCNPNAGFSGQIALVALRTIHEGEEACFDYAMSDSLPYDEFDCACGAKNCRHKVTGNDWKLPELQKRYTGYFMPYIQRKIDKANAKSTVLQPSEKQKLRSRRTSEVIKPKIMTGSKAVKK